MGEIYEEMRRVVKDLLVNPEPSEYTKGYIDCLRYFMDWIEEEELIDADD